MSKEIIKDHNKDHNKDEAYISKLLRPSTLSVGYKEDEFLISFYGEEIDFEKDSEQEMNYNVVIPKDALKQTILDLIKAGMQYQKEFKEDIGLLTREK